MSTGTPEQVLKSIVDGINTGNLDALMTLYEPDAGFAARRAWRMNAPRVVSFSSGDLVQFPSGVTRRGKRLRSIEILHFKKEEISLASSALRSRYCSVSPASPRAA
jgi:hypothetical protein